MIWKEVPAYISYIGITLVTIGNYINSKSSSPIHNKEVKKQEEKQGTATTTTTLFGFRKATVYMILVSLLRTFLSSLDKTLVGNNAKISEAQLVATTKFEVALMGFIYMIFFSG